MLSGKTALITGAGAGIGRAVAMAYAKEQATIILAARTKANLDAVAAECAAVAGCPGQVKIFPCDLATAQGVEDLAAFVTECGGCDVLVNNAGSMVGGNATTGNPDDWDRMMFLNVNGVLRLTRRLTPAMAEKKWGAIINMCSIAGIEGMSGDSAAYAASKHALRGWNHSIYQSLRFDNIKVMLVNPAFVNTPMVSDSPFAAKTIPDRMIQPEDVGEVCLLPFKLSAGCVPAEVTLRLTLSAMK